MDLRTAITNHVVDMVAVTFRVDQSIVTRDYRIGENDVRIAYTVRGKTYYTDRNACLIEFRLYLEEEFPRPTPADIPSAELSRSVYDRLRRAELTVGELVEWLTISAPNTDING